MMELMKEYQLNVMLALSWICGLLAFFIAITRNLPRKRKYILLAFELNAMFLLTFDRFAYFYRGNTSRTGWWMVRISNFSVFFLMITMAFIFTLYLIDLYHMTGELEKTPLRLKFSCGLCAVGALMLITSQFTGFYYTFDEFNQYQRTDGFVIFYLVPMTTLLLDLSVILKYYKYVSKYLRTSILLFSIVPIVASIVQIFAYGLSLTSISLVGMAIVLYVLSFIDLNQMIERANRREVELVREERHNMQLLFEQTASALASSIDAKDKYTHGHSRRVAEYSVKIARDAGKSEKECNEIYFAALLHDVGKIGIKDSIINKEGRLTDEEFAAIKSHPVIGMQILSSISQSPYLSIGAHYHHERYDGHGYPEGLKGEDIPDIARIIAVADAYDAMTSKRSYRDPIPQQNVREEFVKCSGTQFDPNYARIMLHLIDLDLEYNMKETINAMEFQKNSSMECGSYRSVFSDGILLTNEFTHISFISQSTEEYPSAEDIPSLILFDSLDARIHTDERKCRDLLYFEYATIRIDGKIGITGARNYKSKHSSIPSAERPDGGRNGRRSSYDIEAVRIKDHVRIRIKSYSGMQEIILALPDSTRFAYISLTGEHCTIEDIKTTATGETADEGTIPRIAEEITYINVPAGDIPNVQVDGWRSASSEGIEITDGMKIRFHTMSLPTARLIWHCPFAVLYTADDGQVNGKNFRELTVVRLDGEGWEDDDAAENHVFVTKLDTFTDWNDWKERNKAGQDVELQYHIEKGKITISTTYCGLSLRSVTTVTEDIPKLFTALTGDQCALTNIRIIR